MVSLLMRRPSLEDLPPLPPLANGFKLCRFPDAASATPVEKASLAGTLQAAFETEWTTERLEEALLSAPDVALTLALQNAAGDLVATASARLDERFPGAGYLHWVAVRPDFAGQKLGFWMTLAVLHEFVELGCHAAVLETEDFRLAALKTYLNLGFKPEFCDESHEERWGEIRRVLGTQTPPL